MHSCAHGVKKRLCGTMPCCSSLQTLAGQPIIDRRCWRVAAPRPQRASLAIEGSLARQLCLGAAAATAVGVTAITLRQVLQQRGPKQQEPGRRRRQQQRQQQSPPADETSSSGRDGHRPAWGIGGSSSKWAAMPSAAPTFSLAWPLASKDQQIQRTVQDIEAQRQKEAQLELWRWDERFSLRSRTLAELRELAKKHKIAGRSRMRKQELVASLEAALGFAPHQAGPRQ